MLRILGRVGRVALGHSKKAVTRTSLFKSAPATKERIIFKPTNIIVPALVSKNTFFNWAKRDDKKEEGKKLFAEAQSALETRDWPTAIDRWTKLLAIPMTPDFKKQFISFLRLTAFAFLQAGKGNSNQDMLYAAAIIKLALTESRDDEKAWELYFGAKVAALTRIQEADPNGKITN